MSFMAYGTFMAGKIITGTVTCDDITSSNLINGADIKSNNVDVYNTVTIYNGTAGEVECEDGEVV